MTECKSRSKLAVALSVGLLAFVALPGFSYSGAASRQEQHAAKTQAKKGANERQQSAGQRKFNQNCSRCHKAPQGFPPQISGTILRHMRVRASLSQQDEQEILRFLNP
jgi:mono/diheme cytochrome c family protein